MYLAAAASATAAPGRALDRHSGERARGARLRRQRDPHDARRVRDLRVHGRVRRCALRPPPEWARHRRVPPDREPHRVLDGGDRRARVTLGRTDRRVLRARGEVLPPRQLGPAGQRRRAAARPHDPARRHRRRDRRRAGRVPALGRAGAATCWCPASSPTAGPTSRSRSRRRRSRPRSRRPRPSRSPEHLL